jgi:2-alkyl-3-oxoalkanoate reductase
MRVLLTGATGFLGRYTVRRLRQEGVEVIAVGRNRNALERLQQDGCSICATDLSSEVLSDTLSEFQFDRIIHAAALSSPWGKYEDFYNANVVASTNILKIAKERQTPLVYISTPSVYLGNGITSDIPETAPLSTTPVNHYCSTKIEAEKHLHSWHKETGLPVVVLRPQGLLGAHDPSFAPRICAQLQKGFFPMMNGGRALIDMTHVENVAEAIYLSLKLENSDLKTFNITNGEPRSIRDTVDLFAQELKLQPRYISVPSRVLFSVAKLLELSSNISGGWEPPITVYGMTVMGLERTLSIDLARKELGYEPKKSIEQAVEEYCFTKE